MGTTERGKMYVGDIGITLSIDTGIENLDENYSEAKLHFLSPSGIVAERTPLVSGQRLVYVTTAEDLTEPGVWRLQARVVLYDGTVKRGDTGDFTVYARFA